MSTVPDRDDQVMALVAAALSLGEDARNDYLETACEGDEELLHETSEALEWEQRMGGFLRRPWMSLQDLDRPFHPGQLINGRFEIVREIGQGGMGVVYEALDRKRGQRIAIKSGRLGFRRLLSPELESALKVRHPNVCLVNEIHTASTEYGDVDFLTMELLEGPTLQAHLSAVGRLDSETVLEIARQLCAGLAEAHRIGIIHKDLKTANVLLSRTADGSLRAVITDFGLAGEPTVDSGDLAGTPRYMAPELWRGAAASKASDVYALGVILYEMATGTTPFGDEPSQIRLTRQPPAAGARASHVDRQLDAVISRCLDPSPEKRPRDAVEVFGALTRKSVRKTPLAVAATALLAVVAAAVTWREPLLRRFEPAPVRLAILPVKSSGEAGVIGNGVLSDIADRLAQRSGPPALVVIRPEKNLAHEVDATHALQLTVRQEGMDLLAHSAVIDLATETRLQEISGRYAMSRAGDLSTALLGAVTKALRLRGETAESISAVATTPYLRGLSYLRQDQHSFDLAIPLFREAMRLDPHSPLPPAGIVEALTLEYKETKNADLLAEADRTLREAQALNPDSIAVLLAAGRLDVSRGQYEKALQSYERVADRQPRNIEVLLRIAEVHGELDHRQEAIESYQKAIAIDPDYYEAYQELGDFYYHRGEPAAAAEQFRKATERAPRFHEAYTNLGAVLNELGQDDAAAQALLTSLSLKETGRALNNLAALRAYQKRDDEALVYYKKAYTLEPKSYIYPLNLGDSSRRLGLGAESREYYLRGSEAALSALRNNPKDGRARAFVGYFVGRLGDRGRAEEEIEQALQMDPDDNTVKRRAVLTYEMLGQRDRAMTIAGKMKPDALRVLDRHPDLADFRRDPRFQELKAKNR